MAEQFGNWILWGDYALKLFVSLVLSGLIGFERQLSKKTAGLRTHMLVCMGATIFTLTGLYLMMDYSENFATDPIRIVDAMIGGLGFLGAGAIIQARGSIQGLTTATSIWTMGALGVAVGLGNYPLAILTTVFSLMVLWLIDRMENKFIKKDVQKET